MDNSLGLEHATDPTLDNNTGSDRTFKRQEQVREDITGQYNATDPIRANNTGSERTFQTQEQYRDNSTGQ